MLNRLLLQLWVIKQNERLLHRNKNVIFDMYTNGKECVNLCGINKKS